MLYQYFTILVLIINFKLAKSKPELIFAGYLPVAAQKAHAKRFSAIFSIFVTFDTPEKKILKRNAFCGHWLCLCLCLCRCLLQLHLDLGLLLFWLWFWLCVCGRGTRVPDTRPYANEAQSGDGGGWVEAHRGTAVATFGALCLAQWRNRKCDCAARK